MLHFPNGTKAKLIDVNPRSEKHGDELVPALDLRVQVETSKEVLAQLDPELPKAFYQEPAQRALDGVQNGWDLRFPHLDPGGRWDEQADGYGLDLEVAGDSGKRATAIRLVDCKLHKIAWTMRQGGTVQLAFTASCTHDLTPAKVGLLGMRVQHDVTFGLQVPPQ